MIFRIIKTAEISADDLRQCFCALSEREKQYILNKSKPDVQKNSLAGQFAVRKGLKELFGIENPQILRQKIGKPYLKNNEVFFSVSHTADIVAVAFSEYPVGIDIEYPREYSKGVCRRMFNCEENLYAQKSNINFTKIWTLKEAAVKASGEGISAAKKYNFTFCGDQILSNTDNSRVTQRIEDNLIISVFELI